MSMRLEMLQVARLAPKLLGESTELVRDYLLRQQNEEGGFRDRNGKNDLYYTVFGLDGLRAVEVPNSGTTVQSFERAAEFLRSFGDGAELDFVHLCCLARGWAAVSTPDSTEPCPGPWRNALLRRIEDFRSKDGGYNPGAGADFGTAYGCFLALGAYQDLRAKLPEPLRLVPCLKLLETEDGAWTNERAAVKAPAPHVNVGSTNATAAAATVLRNLSLPVNASAGDWLLGRAHPAGGFLAAPNAPMPDLLSTASALHALAGMQFSLGHIKEKCLDYIDTLWTNEGAFHGHWGDDAVDCEYTFYGLLALGHLSLY